MQRSGSGGASLESLKIRVLEGSSRPGILRKEFAWIKQGPRRFKTAALFTFGSAGRVSSQELVLQAWEKDPNTEWRAFDGQRARWFCEGEEIDHLRNFLNTHSELGGPGDYVVMEEKAGSLLAALNRLNPGDRQQTGAFLRTLTQSSTFLDAAADEALSEALISGIQVRRQAAVVARLKEAVLDPTSTEAVFQKLLGEEWWIFGGRYLRRLGRRQLTVLDQLDLPLLRTDEVLHVIELKQAHVPRLVIRYRNHFSVGPEVNETVNQVANYLRALDEQRSQILADLGVDCRRAFATIIIGSPQHVADIGPDDVREAIRTYNSHLSRIEVLTYDDLVRAAENSVKSFERDAPTEGGF